MSMPFSASSSSQTVGIDAGATLCKIAHLHGKMIVTHTIPSREIAGIRDYIATLAGARVSACGGGAARLAAALPELTVDIAAEFEAWARGAPALAHESGIELPAGYLLVSLGTGTSILHVPPGDSRPQRVGGTALGGGTLMGLGKLLLAATDFDQLVACAATGDRSRVDLLVGDVYAGQVTPLPADLNASSFAKLASREPQDLAKALVALIGENVGLLCGQLVARFGVRDVVYCGSTLNGNEVLRDVLRTLAELHGHRACFPERGAFCGAIGAALMPVDRRDARAG